MKLLQTLMIICLSIVAKGQDVNFNQDIRFTLTHGGSRKWTGVDKTQILNGQSSINLIFHTNHNVEETPVNSHKSTIVKKWHLLNSTTTHDENIKLEIGGTDYNVIFSKTANGSDFMTLTYTKNERVYTASYYCE